MPNECIRLKIGDFPRGKTGRVRQVGTYVLRIGLFRRISRPKDMISRASRAPRLQMEARRRVGNPSGGEAEKTDQSSEPGNRVAETTAKNLRNARQVKASLAEKMHPEIAAAPRARRLKPRQAAAGRGAVS